MHKKAVASFIVKGILETRGCLLKKREARRLLVTTYKMWVYAIIGGKFERERTCWSLD